MHVWFWFNFFSTNLPFMSSGTLNFMSYQSFVMIFMAALWNRAGHCIFILLFVLSIYLSSFFSSPNLSRCRLDVYHSSTHGVALVRI